MTREEFEAEVWRVAGRRLDRLDVTRILVAADAFAAAEGGVTAERRMMLAKATTRKRRTTVACWCGCGTRVVSRDSHGRDRRYAPGHNRDDAGRWAS